MHDRRILIDGYSLRMTSTEQGPVTVSPKEGRPLVRFDTDVANNLFFGGEYPKVSTPSMAALLR